MSIEASVIRLINYSFIKEEKINLCKELIECECNCENFIPYLVETPKPYLIDLSGYDDKEKVEIMRAVDSQVLILNTVLDEMGISREESIQNDYTLNESSIIKLMYIAWNECNEGVKDKLNMLLDIVPKGINTYKNNLFSEINSN